ncbi:MAG: zinc ABC transporter substrate-binding protein [Desulfomonile tiedjei]|uniref:Zinc ABC transporter substrate-binding protein n=1 Tax=Desulfomonile tiedjei TaxID=2358 RepID=A0A9D6V426_9BACT|nr:zinc ABC transporter substrate-binding protein [Desulfomonile tiedjei]
MKRDMFIRPTENARTILTYPVLRGYDSMWKRSGTLIFSLLLLIIWGSLSAGAEVKSSGKIKAFVSILPMTYFVERVGGPNVEVNVLVGPGQDPHTFEPTPKLMAKLADSQILFKIGFPFEETIIKKVGSTFKNLQVIDLQQGIKLRAMTEEEVEAEEAEHGHEHSKDGEKHEHSHEAGDMDQHTWLDPRLAKIQARTIADTLIRIDPGRKDQYEKNLKDLQTDLDAIHEQLTKSLAPVKGKSFFVFHPAYGYFGDAYGLKQIAVQLGGKEPTARQLARLIELAKEAGVRVIFVQPQFSQKSAEALSKAIGGAVVPLDDLAPDYLKNLKEMAAKLDSALHSRKK